MLHLWIVWINCIVIEKKQIDLSVKFRNQLFVALNIAKCWVKVMGVGDYKFYEEFNKAININERFEFKFINPKNNADDLEAKDVYSEESN